MSRKLIEGIDLVRQRLRELSATHPGDERLRDAQDLVGVLIRVIEGRDVLVALGAPGDWGYGTPIGDGLFAAWRARAQESRS